METPAPAEGATVHRSCVIRNQPEASGPQEKDTHTHPHTHTHTHTRRHMLYLPSIFILLLLFEFFVSCRNQLRSNHCGCLQLLIVVTCSHSTKPFRWFLVGWNSFASFEARGDICQPKLNWFRINWHPWINTQTLIRADFVHLTTLYGVWLVK